MNIIDRFKLGLKLTGKSWSVLRADGSLALFPVISGLATICLFTVLWAPALGLGLVDIETTNAAAGQSGQSVNVLGWILVALTAYLATVVAVFCNVALAGCVAKSLQGENTSLRDGFLIARSRIKQILAWSLIATVVSMIIRTIQERGGIFGAIVGMIGGVAWNLATLFVVPVIALEGVGPIDALKHSAQTFKARWGEGLIGNTLIGLVTGLMIMTCLALAIGGVILLNPLGAAAVISWLALCLVTMLAVAAIMAALNQVFNTSLYIFSKNGQAAGPFTEQEFAAAFRSKK